MPKKSMATQTAILNMDESRESSHFSSFATPVVRASTVTFNTLAELRAISAESDHEWSYGIRGTPTSYALAQRLALIEGAQYASLYPSGLSAITHLYLAFLKAGDEMLLPGNIYAAARDSADWLTQRFNIQVRFYDPTAGAAIAALIQKNTRLIWLEAPGSISMEVPNIDEIVAVAKKYQVLTAIDNTYSAGLSFKPFTHDIDLSVQALTKYQSGASDVLAGAIITNQKTLHLAIKQARNYLGTAISPEDCALILRSLPSMAVRYAHHSEQALTLATWLKQRPEIEKVLHPNLPDSDCIGHEYFKAHFSSAGGLFSVVFSARYTMAHVERFIDALTLFAIGWSWGGAHSLAMPYTMHQHPQWQEKGALVRFFVGLENIDDLIADIEQAMEKALR